MKKILIYGSKSYAKLLQTILQEDLAIDPLCFIDDEPEKSQSSRDRILSLDDALRQYSHDVEILLGVGYSNLPLRLSLIDKLKNLNLKLFTLIHPDSYVSKSAVIESGCVIMQKAIVSQNCRIGEGSVLWQGVNISHDCTVGSNCFLSPSSTICGFSTVGHSTFVGSNSTIVNNLTISANSFIKAGSLVKRSI